MANPDYPRLYDPGDEAIDADQLIAVLKSASTSQLAEIRKILGIPPLIPYCISFNPPPSPISSFPANPGYRLCDAAKWPHERPGW